MSQADSHSPQSADWIEAAARSRLEYFNAISPWSGHAIVSEACRSLDRDIDASESALRSFRARRYALAPVARLPAEILVCIFAYLVPHAPLIRRTRTRARDPLGWISVTHVCRRWRAVAIDCAGLWANIDVSLGARWMEEFLNRSKGIPVGIDVPDYLAHFFLDRHVELAAEHMHHIKSLSLDVRSVASILALSRLLSSAAPVLESVSLTHAQSLPPNSLFSDTAPQLRRLSATDFVGYPWPFLTLKSLQYLSLSASHHTPESQTSSLGEILESLAQMTGLVELVLENCLPNTPAALSPSIPRHRVVTLPHVRLLGLTGAVTDCTTLLTHLHLPAMEVLDNRFKENDGAGYTLYFPVLKGLLGGRSAPPFNALYFASERPGTSFFVHISRNHTEPSDNAVLSTVALEFRWTSETSSADLMRELCDVLSNAGLSRLQLAVPISLSDGPWSTAEWQQIFGRLRGIEELEVSYEFPEALCEALCTSVQSRGMTDWALPTEPDHRRRYFFLQGLSVLKISRTELSPSLKRALEVRKVWRTPLKSVHISECWATAETVDALREFVETVEWDGVKDGYAEDEDPYLGD